MIYRHREKYIFSEMLRFFSDSRSEYNDFVKWMDIPANDFSLPEKIKECQKECGKTYGYCRVHLSSMVGQRFGLCRNTICDRLWEEKNIIITVRFCTNIPIFWTEISLRCIVSFINQGAVWQQHCFLQNKHDTKCTVGFGDDKDCHEEVKGHRRVAAQQWPKFSIHFKPVF